MTVRLLCRQCRWTFFRLNEMRRYSQDQKESTKTVPYENITVETSHTITTICLNRPSSRNSLDTTTLTELGAALRAFDADARARAVVIVGEGGNLSSGLDLFELKKLGFDALRDAARVLLRRPLTDKPSVCAVSGFAVGAGLELALACDLRVVEDTAVLGFLGRRFGVPNSLDGAARLTSLVGLSRALDLVLTGRLIPGTVAHEWGLAARLVATGTGIGQALNLAMSICKFPAAAMLQDKMAAVNSQLGSECADDFARNDAMALRTLADVIVDVQNGVEKFSKGVGRHGKSSGLTEQQLKPWERHDSDDQLV